MVSQDNQKWKTVTCNNSHTKNTHLQQLGKGKNSYVTSNRFTPLSNLNDDLQDATSASFMCKDKQLPATHLPKKPATQRYLGSKIPTIVNGRISHNSIRNNSRKQPNIVKPSTKVIPSSIVKIIGDSHLKEANSRIGQYLSSKFELSSFIKPGACINHIVRSQENELKTLGLNDVIIINGGSNDLNTHNFKETGTLTEMVNFICNYNNTDILIVNLPHRFGHVNTSKTDHLIHHFYSKLKSIVKAFQHVTLIAMSLDRNHYTKHGLHLNNYGKEIFAKQTASITGRLISSSNLTKSIIALEWKEKTLATTLTPTSTHIDNSGSTLNPTVKPSTLETLSHITSNSSSNLSQPRISTRNKKAPETKTTDFLW